MFQQRWGIKPYWRKFRDLMRTRKALRRAERFGKVSFSATEIRSLADNYTPLSAILKRVRVDRVRIEEAIHASDTLTVGRLVLLPKDRTLALMFCAADQAGISSEESSRKTSPETRAKHPTNPRTGIEEKVA
jgi:hypothetical protein